MGRRRKLAGGKKTEESVLGLFRARKYLQRRFGSVHVSFGEPISLAGALGGQRERFEALQRGEISSTEVRTVLEEEVRAGHEEAARPQPATHVVARQALQRGLPVHSDGTQLL